MRPHWYPAAIGLGSNLGKPHAHLVDAVGEIGALPRVSVQSVSSAYASKPMGPADQPDYVNAVLTLLTTAAPEELLASLQAIEVNHGRTRNGERWGPRTLDLDLLLYGGYLIEKEQLTVPHAGIAERNFVLLPLCELAPHWNVPGRGSVRALLAELAKASDGIEKLGLLIE